MSGPKVISVYSHFKSIVLHYFDDITIHRISSIICTYCMTAEKKMSWDMIHNINLTLQSPGRGTVRVLYQIYLAYIQDRH